MNQKKLRRRGGRKRAFGTRAPLALRDRIDALLTVRGGTGTQPCHP